MSAVRHNADARLGLGMLISYVGGTAYTVRPNAKPSDSKV
jgi:hypothetical protein